MDANLLKQHIFNDQSITYAILDGALIPNLPAKFDYFSQPHISLYRGELGSDIKGVAPYLTVLNAEEDFTNWVLQRSFGSNQGIFILSNLSFVETRKHFRGFLQVYDENSKLLLFRYYDPRVLRTYLPTCSTLELNEFFGEVKEIFCESKVVNELLSFSLKDGVLVTKNYS